jgi:hypothetical protein
VELDDMKALWKEADRRVEAMEPVLQLQLRLAQIATRERARSRLRFVRVALWYEVVFGVLAALLAGSYLAEHVAIIRFAIPAAILQAVAIGVLGFAAYQLVALEQIDPAGSVVTIQRSLARLRVVRARSNRWLLLSAPLLWALLTIVVPHGLSGLDVYAAFGPAWVIGNVVFGFAVLGAAALASRRVSETSRGAAILRWIGDDATGRRVGEASTFLDEIAAFEAA